MTSAQSDAPRGLTARDHLIRQLDRTTRTNLVIVAMALAPGRGDEWLIGGPDTWTKDELIAYIAPPRAMPATRALSAPVHGWRAA